MKIIFFDFDGTITNRNSLPDFIKFAVGKKKYYIGLLKLSPMLLQYLLKIISNSTAKENLIKYFFRGWDATTFCDLGNTYAKQYLNRIVREEALMKIKEYNRNADKVVVVSASLEFWLQAWCKENKVDLIATKLEVVNNVITGKFATKNCYGPEKVSRIKREYNLEKYDSICAYGDSSGDKEMLAIANEKFYRFFN